MKVAPVHAAVLEALADEDDRTIAAVAAAIDEKPETVTGAAFALEDDGLVRVDEAERTTVSLTPEGTDYEHEGLPERRLYDAAVEQAGADTPVPLGDVLATVEFAGAEIDIALSNLARKGLGSIEDGQLTVVDDPPPDEEAAALAAIAGDEADEVDDAVLDQLERRNLVATSTDTERTLSLRSAGADAVEEGLEVAEEIGPVTPELLISGEWERAEFRPYNVTADPPPEIGGRVHPLRQMAERVKDVLIGMGFREMDGPHVDADFWINDCLFMPQDHPARTHWDRFALEEPERIDELPAELVERVESAHREGVGDDGEGYRSPWDEEFARTLALRGHTTSLSARYLSGREIGSLEPPQRFFSVEKVYRNDTLDATHLLEFFQIEGWVMADELSVRDLMGTFTEFYEHFGITDLEFKPHYNPYTEPSFELFGTHPRTGELIEIGNSGIFRPEMLEPLGVEADVMAWGLALERLLMLVTGAEDIRDVHGTLVDLEYLRTEEVIY